MLRLRLLLLFLPVVSGPEWIGAAPYHLVDNGTSAWPSSGEIACSVDFESPRVGLASARLQYTVHPDHRQARLGFPDLERRVAGPGVLKAWVKGDGSGNQLEFVVRHAEPRLDAEGRKSYQNHQNLALPRVPLDFTGWKELSFDATALPAGNREYWVHGVTIHAPKRKDDDRPSGQIEIDDLRLFPTSGKVESTRGAGLIGPSVRGYTRDIAVYLDIRSFVPRAAAVSARLTMTDRNENLVASREFRLALNPEEAREFRLALEPENLESYLPPFRIAGDAVSADLPGLSERFSYVLVMGNGLVLFDDLSDVYGRWFTAGYKSDPHNTWLYWCHGENQRASPSTQTTISISTARMAELEKEGSPGAGPAGAAVGSEGNPAGPNPALADGGAVAGTPPGKFAMRIDYSGPGFVYTGPIRYFPGNAFRAGFWVRGNGSKDRLSAAFLDYTDGADFWIGGWKRIGDWNRAVPLVCTLDFQGWRYFEVPLPGDGRGTNTPAGSTYDIDFPIELTALVIQPAKDSPGGTLHVGPILAHTQVESANSLSLHVGYEDPEHQFRPESRAWVMVQNGSRTQTRQVRTTWALVDRAGEVVLKGKEDRDLAPQAWASFPAECGTAAQALASRPAPFTLQVAASDLRDGSVSATRELVLARPDSRARVSGFERKRGYLGLRAGGMTPKRDAQGWSAWTSTEQAHEGQYSLAMPWDKENQKSLWVSVDPALPGVPTELSLWVYGDGSGVLFWPLIGDRQGVRHGAGPVQWDLFHLRTAGDPPRNAVRIDWTGWRELRFHLPVIPPSYAQPLPILPWVPSYPLCLHLAIDAEGASGDKGIVYVDDVTTVTHLPAEQRLEMVVERWGESNVLPPGESVRVLVANRDASLSRKARLVGGAYNWRGELLSGVDQNLDLRPGESRSVTAAGKLPVGAWILRLRLEEGERLVASTEEDLLVADLRPVLGNDWETAIDNEWKLRRPVRDSYTFVDEDWDWVEHYAGSRQLDTIRIRSGKVKENGADPYVLIGYSAYWAAGVGFQEMKAGSFERRLRDVGHAVDIFLVPERMEDWDDYCCELMRGVGKDVAGWVVWNSPDSRSSLSVRPEQLSVMLGLANKWRQAYCPQTPLVIGGLSQDRAIPYLRQVAEKGGLDHISGVNVRMDLGRLSPEDARVTAYVRELQGVLSASGRGPRNIILEDLDWAVEKDPKGLGVFEQAAYLARSDILLHPMGIQPTLSVRNDDYVRLGLGLTYRRDLDAPPMTVKLGTFQFKPAWWAVYRTRQWLEGLRFVQEIPVMDVVPGRTRCFLFQRRDAAQSVAIVWRNDPGGHLSFGATGVPVVLAEDVLGGPVVAGRDGYPVGKMPERFVLDRPAEQVAQALALLRVRDGEESSWPQRVMARFTPAAGQRHAYSQRGGQPAARAGQTVYGDPWEGSVLAFEDGGTESFQIDVPAGAGVVLRKEYWLEGPGQTAEVQVNGQPAGIWNLKRSGTELGGGPREAVFVVDGKRLEGSARATVECRYTGPANTASWTVLEYRDGVFPLSALGPIHAEQNVSIPRLARNVIGAPIRVQDTTYENGLGVFAHSLLEYPLNRQFRRFQTTVGVDASTEGKGSVVFEIVADGRKVWSSGVVSGLDGPKKADTDVEGVDRLRLMVTDANDGNQFDAADWCDPILLR